MLHLGLGSFHRAHQAVYLHRLIASGDERWVLAGGNLRPDMADTLTALAGQGGRYTLETVTPDGTRDYEWITSIRHVLPYEPSLAGLIDVGADPRTRIISFTVTEGGYYLDGRNRLDLSNAELASDLDGRTQQTVYGGVAAILRERMRRDAGPVSLLNCDNLRHNGERFRAGLLEFLERRDEPGLLDWVAAHTTCPNGMVDRITPRPSPDVAERVRLVTGRHDAVPVMGESFIQWVIEDDFCAGRPAWETVGVQMVASVQPYEEAKIRILNGTHSCIAWAGTLAGCHFIHEGLSVPAIRRMAMDYVTDDVIPCLHSPESPSPIDLAAYRDTVLARFGNAAIRDTNQRVAMDGYSKIPGFIAPTVRERLAAGQPIAGVARLPALFLAFLQRWHRDELPYAYQDQGMDPAAARAICASADPVAALCADPVLWHELAGDARLTAAVRGAFDEVHTTFAGALHG
ncbi:mannitol dehydrogenase family protein [Schlegelella sp. S2-27]|uniref:Mannitol dehydrogenase family protein n=1 Tax=Caldimonas mangrovi TaxID=2944811 RepID=A0ABT0YN19_9BURK|nr:D-arabinitol 4-dehydrogenase [Caldimonas mangrovi]MCM5680123.1 mannitol dehydrogenase family protein [Caldimonas mangrovi]